jgi:hypothetical protein
MTSHKINNSRKLSFQPLEDRQLMAANVTGAVSNHSLTLTGDSSSDLIEITQVANNQFKVSGDNGTLINGKASQTFNNVTGNISVVFKSGFNAVTVGQENFPNPETYTTLPGSLNVAFGNGVGSFSAFYTSIGGNLTIAGGHNDYISLINSGVGRANVNGGNHDCNITLGNGSNTVKMQYTTVERDLLIHDIGSSSTDDIDLWGGNVGRNATLQTGVGNDMVQFNEMYIGKALNIQTGAGNDEVVLGEFLDTIHYDPTDNGVMPNTQWGVHADNIYADLGAGNDTLRTARVDGLASYNGNTGTDNLFHDDGTHYGVPFDGTGFEYVDGIKYVVPTHHSAVTLKA